MKTLVEQQENAKALRSGNLERPIRRFWEAVFTEPGTEILKERAAKFTASLPVETVTSFFLDREEDKKLGVLLPGIKIPTLVINGTDDQRISSDLGREIANRIPNALFYSMEGKGHNLMATGRAEFCEVLRRFVMTGTVPEPSKADR